MKGILAAFAKNTVFANILLVLVFMGGTMAVVSMVREPFPQFSLDMITITVVYPGADPEEVEEGICRKLEEAVESVEGIKLFTTYASENSGTALIEVKEDYDIDQVLDKVRSNVDAISTFPADAEKPIITELMLKDPVIMLYLAGDMTERRLKEWAERTKDELQLLDQISQVTIFGAREYEINIEISEARLREYHLSFDQVARAVAQSNLNLGGGTIRTQGEEIRVRTMGRKYTGEQLADIVVLARPTGEIITLDKIARIKDGFRQDPIKATVNGEPGLLMIIFKTTEEDAIEISKVANRYLKEKKAVLPQGAVMDVLYDNTEMLRDRINLMVKNGILGLILVFVILWLFLDKRLSFWGGMGIPISVSGALTLIWAMGETINMITLGGFIMVLGIVVDDAIVVGEAIFTHRKNGKPPLKAAVDGVCEVGMPVVAAVFTSVVAFVPLRFVGGIMGKFISILPVVVIACLVFSLVECMFMLPAHLSHLPDLNQPPKRPGFFDKTLGRVQALFGRGLEWFAERVYAPFLNASLKWRYIFLCLAIATLVATFGLFAGGFLKFEVMPDVDGFVITSNIEFPPGTPPKVTAAAAAQMEEALKRLEEKFPTATGEPLIEKRLSLVGQTLEDIPNRGPHLAGVQAILLPSERRRVHYKTLLAAWEKEAGEIPGAKSVTFEGISTGPPGAPIEVWVQGHDMDRILAASDDLMNRLEKFEGVYQIRSDFSPGKNELRLFLKPEARVLGLTLEDLARQVYAGYFGQEAVRLQRGRDDVRVKIRYAEAERARVSDLANIRIRTPDGRQVPLFSVADARFAPGYAKIIRTNGMRRVAVSADVDDTKANTTEILQELKAAYFPELFSRYPGVSVSVQGEQKKLRESLSSLAIGYPLAIVGIIIIIATIFRSYVQPIVILVTIPFGIIGAVAGHFVMGYNLSLMSIFGMVALTGVVVNDAIVLIERVNENLADGMPFYQALRQGGQRRFRAIFLTTVSTVGGVAPMILETNFQARFLIPMVLSLAAGVSFRHGADPGAGAQPFGDRQ